MTRPIHHRLESERDRFADVAQRGLDRSKVDNARAKADREAKGLISTALAGQSDEAAELLRKAMLRELHAKGEKARKLSPVAKPVSVAQREADACFPTLQPKGAGR